MIKRDELVKYINKYLNIWNFSDYGPNGLHVEGSSECKKIAFAVSATKHSIEENMNVALNHVLTEFP